MMNVVNGRKEGRKERRANETENKIKEEKY